MKKHYFASFDFVRNEEELSPYGRSVLQLVLRKWSANRQQNVNHINVSSPRPPWVQRPRFFRDKVLTFEDANVVSSVESHADVDADAVYEDVGDDVPFEFDDVVIRRQPPPPPPPPPLSPPIAVVPTSVQLINSIDKHVADMSPLHVPKKTTQRQVSPICEPRGCQFKTPPPPPPPPPPPQNVVSSLYPPTASALLNTVATCDDVPASEQHSTLQDKHDQQTNKSHPETDNRSKAEQLTNDTKRTIQSKVTDNVPKKVTKADGVSKHPFRKEKYTKAVKDWLRSVEPALAADAHETGGLRGPQTVQARLTNIGGTMKYAKPPPVSTTTASTSSLPADTLVTATAPVNKKRFVAPLKNNTQLSQAQPTPLQTPTESQSPTTKQPSTEARPPTTKNKSSTTKKQPPTTKKRLPTTKKQPSITKNQVPSEAQRSSEPHPHIEPQAPSEPQRSSEPHPHIEPQPPELVFPAGCELVVMLVPSEAVLLLHGDCAYRVDAAAHSETRCLRHVLLSCTLLCYEGARVLRHCATRARLPLHSAGIAVRDLKVAGSLLWADNPPATLEGLHRAAGAEGSQPASEPPADGWAALVQRARLIRSTAAALFPRLRADGLWTLFVELEMRVLPIIAAMEQRGIPIDVSLAQRLSAAVAAAEAACERAAHAEAGSALPLRAPAALARRLYDELGLHTRARQPVRRTARSGARSVDEDMLVALRGVHPLPALVLRYRRLRRARTATLEPLLRHAVDHAVHPSWLQCAAATGRIGCARPNVQALPVQPMPLTLPLTVSPHSPPPPLSGDDGDSLDGDRADVPGESGEASSSSSSANIRAVVRARAGYTLVALDYRHTECRLIAAAARDQALLTALTAPDIFEHLAAYWLDKPVREINSTERALAKRVLYALTYGCGPARLRRLSGPSGHIQRMTATFTSKFPGVRAFMSAVWARAAADGGVLRLSSGRRRRLGGEGGGALTARERRQAVNFMIQGAAADLCKLAMVRTQHAIKHMDARLLLTLHDELLWEVSTDIVRPFAEVVRAEMESCGAEVCGGGVHMPVSVRAGPTWGAMTTLQLDLAVHTN